MQKTKEIVHNPISDEAYGLLGERGEGLIFEDSRTRCCKDHSNGGSRQQG